MPGNGSSATLASAGGVIVDAKNNGNVDPISLAASAPGNSSGANSSSSSGGVGISGDVSINQVDNDTTRAYVHNAKITATALTVNAANLTKIIAITGAAALIQNPNGSSAGIAASYAQNNLNDITTDAFINNATVTLTGDLNIDATANGKIYSVAISGSLILGSQGLAIAGQASINTINGGDTEADIESTTVAADNVTATAGNDKYIFALAGALAAGGNTGIGAALGYNTITDQAHAYVDSSSIGSSQDPAGAVTLSATDSGKIQSITIGGAGAQTFALGGAVGVNHVTNTSDAHISGGAQVDASGAVAVTAADTLEIDALAGGLAFAGTAAIGAAIATNNIDDTTQAYLDGSGVAAGNLTLSATSSATIESLTVAGAGSGTFSLGGAVGVNSIDDSASAYITDGATTEVGDLDPDGGWTIHRSRPDAGAPWTPLEPWRSQPASPRTISATRRRSTLDAASQVQGGTTTISATEDANIEAASIGVSVSADVAVTDAVGVNEIHNTTDAHISGSLGIGRRPRRADRPGHLRQQLADRAGGRFLGWHRRRRVVQRRRRPRARTMFQNATVNAGTLSIQALFTATINTITAGLSGGVVAIGGSVAVNLLQSDVSAYIAASVVQAGDQILVQANMTDQLQASAGAASGGVVAAAGTVVVNTMNNTTRAYIEASTVNVTTGQVSVYANSVEQPNPNGDGDTLAAVNVSGGLVGIGGLVSVNTVNDITQAFIASSQVNPNLSLTSPSGFGDVTVRATSQVNLQIISGGLSGGFVGASATIDRTTVTGQTSAFISSSDESGSYAYPTTPSIVYAYNVNVGTSSTENIQRTVVGGGFGAVGVSGAVAVLNVNVVNSAFVHDSDVYAVAIFPLQGVVMGNLSITVNDTTTVGTKVGDLAGGAVGAGASINVNTIQNTVEAQVLGGHLNASGATTVAATSNESITPLTGTGSLGVAALAGAVTVNTIQTTTQAVIASGSRPSLINLGFVRFQAGGVFDPRFNLGFIQALNDLQTVNVTANDTAVINAHTGSVAIGIVGAGASVDVSAIRNRTVRRSAPRPISAASGDVPASPPQVNHTHRFGGRGVQQRLCGPLGRRLRPEHRRGHRQHSRQSVRTPDGQQHATSCSRPTAA